MLRFARSPLPLTPVTEACSCHSAFRSMATQSTSGSTRSSMRGTIPAVCKPTRKPSAFTSRIASSRHRCRVGSPPLNTTASSMPCRLRRKRITSGHATSSLPREARRCGLWQYVQRQAQPWQNTTAARRPG